MSTLFILQATIAAVERTGYEAICYQCYPHTALQVQTEDAMLGHAHLLSGSTTTAAMCDAECQTDTMTPPRTSPAPSVESIPCSSEPAGQCTMVSAECQTDAGPERSIAVGTEDTWSERGRQCAPTLVSTECQTVNEPSELSLDVCVEGTKPEGQCSQTVRMAPCVGPSHHCGGALESSICIHRDETKKTVERMENVRELYVYIARLWGTTCTMVHVETTVHWYKALGTCTYDSTSTPFGGISENLSLTF